MLLGGLAVAKKRGKAQPVLTQFWGVPETIWEQGLPAQFSEDKEIWPITCDTYVIDSPSQILPILFRDMIQNAESVGAVSPIGLLEQYFKIILNVIQIHKLLWRFIGLTYHKHLQIDVWGTEA